MNRYDNATILKTSAGRPYYKGKFYPNIPASENDYYVITNVGDRLDSLAAAYYRDSTLWWVIAAANNNITQGMLFPVPGTQLRIPGNIGDILAQFNDFNNAR
jgi:nucleoid-associated protein YgaU